MNSCRRAIEKLGIPGRREAANPDISRFRLWSFHPEPARDQHFVPSGGRDFAAQAISPRKSRQNGPKALRFLKGCRPIGGRARVPLAVRAAREKGLCIAMPVSAAPALANKHSTIPVLLLNVCFGVAAAWPMPDR